MSQGSAIQARANKAYLKLAASSACFLLFLGLHLNLIFLNHGAYSAIFSFAPLAVAFVILPRSVLGGEVDLTDDHQTALLVRLGKIEQWAMWARIAYLLISISVVLILPRVIPPPTG